MELRRYARLIARRIVFVAVCAIVGAAVGYAATSRTPLYRASATIYVGSRAVSTDPQQIYNQAGLAQIANTFATMIPDASIAASAVQAAGVRRSPSAVASATKAFLVPNTTLIQVTVTDTDASAAERLVNGTVNTFADRVQHFNGAAAGKPGQLPAEPAYVYHQATAPGVALPTGATKHTILGGIFGLIVAVLAVLLTDYLDVTVRDPEELERRTSLMVLGTIPLRPGTALSGQGRLRLSRGRQ